MYVPRLSDYQRRSCESKAGEVKAVTDDRGCIKEYKCFSRDELIEQSISSAQRPGCGINPEVKKKLIACREKNQPNYDPIKYDENGCLLDIQCRP